MGVRGKLLCISVSSNVNSLCGHRSFFSEGLREGRVSWLLTLTAICITSCADNTCIMYTIKNKMMLLEDIYYLKDKVLWPEDSLKM